jgi:predicted DNA-binding ribbon-helix-helix protein
MTTPAVSFPANAPEPSEKTIPRSSLVSRNIVICGRRTSIRLEPEMWDGLREIGRREGTTMHHVCTSVALQKSEETSLTASIRVFVMRYFRNASTEEGHGRAGHGYGLTLGMKGNETSPAYAPPSAMTLTKTSFA